MTKTSLRNQRGAAFLLSAYVTSLVLLALGGMSLQRTLTDLQSARTSRDLEQTFWLAEGALDQALTQLKTQQLVDAQRYEDTDSLFGRSYFELATTTAAVIPPFRGQPARQRIQRTITATGRTDSGLLNSVSGMIQEEGPLEGLWGNGVVIVHGGANFKDVFMSGTMHSGVGALSSTIANGQSYGLFDMLFGKARQGAIELTGLAYANDSADLQSKASRELRSVVEGYKFIRGIPLGAPGERYTNVEFTDTAQQGAIQHISGAGSVGLISRMRTGSPLPPEIRPATDCAGNLVLGHDASLFSSGSTLRVEDGFAQGAVRDLTGPGDKRITLCVKSIYPTVTSEYGWFNTIVDEPPQVRFSSPATIYVTGSQTVNFDHLTLGSPMYGNTTFGGMMNWLGVRGVQHDWNISVAAKMTAEQPLGRQLGRIRNGVNLVVAETKPSVVWVEPGRFSGSIYAPNALVIMRQRDNTAVRYEGSGASKTFVPLELFSIVGNEVLIELENDVIQFGGTSGADDGVEESTASVLLWRAAGSALDVSEAAEGVAAGALESVAEPAILSAGNPAEGVETEKKSDGVRGEYKDLQKDATKATSP